MTMFIPELLSFHARLTPDAPAVLSEGAVLSYATLHGAASLIASRIDALASDDGDITPVAVCMPKSALAVAALYGVLLSGRSYIPLDPALPLDRMKHIVAAAGVRRMITDDRETVPAQAASALDLPHIALDGEIFSLPAQEYRRRDITGDQRAAILFTSGSTGVPKGAVITHGNLSSFIDWAAEAFALSPADRLASHAPLQFDLSFFDLFAALRVGAAVSLVPADIAGNGQLLLRFIGEQRITIWQSVPSAIGLLVDAAGEPVVPPAPELRAVLFAGERMPVARLHRSLKIFGGARHYNIYGCTESNDTFMYEVPCALDAIPDPLPIGLPLPYVDFKILDEDGKDVPEGSPGTLWVAAPSLMEGYLDQDETARVISVLTGRDGAKRRYYCTRDLVRRNAGGTFDFLGRTDSVIKTSGFRVNLQEVEGKLADHAHVDEAGVIAIPDDNLGNKLLAVVKPVEGRTLTSLELKLYCGTRLPKYMIPHLFRFTAETLPKNRNGKIDKKALQNSFGQS